jgi:NtrC-family two-component system sensor histidine kinase KinB
MKTKSKVSLGIGFLFVLIICMGAAGIYFIKALSRDSSAIIKNNLISIDYVQAMQKDIDEINQAIFEQWPGKDHRIDIGHNFLQPRLNDFKKNLDLENQNITEEGEQAAVDSLKKYFNTYQDAAYIMYFESLAHQNQLNSSYLAVNRQLENIYNLNQKAILRKNELASRTASQAITYITIIGTIFFLVAFVFIINFPGYIANPIRELSDKIRAIADGDFRNNHSKIKD